MKKISKLVLISTIILILVACSSGEIKEEDKYIVDSLYSYGGTSDKTEVSYEIIISGTKKDIEKLESYEVIINTDYLDSMLENGPHSNDKELGEQSYVKLTGEFTLDTSRNNKQQVDKNKLLNGVKLIDKDKNEVILELNKQWSQ